jgi:hypothetical protein
MRILVNKPGASDRSSKLHEQTLATYFKLESLDSNLVPGVIQLVPLLGLTKAWIPVFLSVPSASTGIFFVSWIWKFTSRAHSCVNTRPCRMDPKVLPSWSLRSRYSDMLSRRTRSENMNLLRALFGSYNTWNHRVTLLNLSQIPPDGSEMSSLLSGVFHRW